MTDPLSTDSMLHRAREHAATPRTDIAGVAAPAGDPRFHEALIDMGNLHDKKQADYGRSEDPFANVRASEDFGIDGWVGCMMRANDKMRRLQKAASDGKLLNESVEDSLMDLAVYAVIGLVLFREASEQHQAEGEVDSFDSIPYDKGDLARVE